ncbi:hypothetical protein [Microbacterium enclense]|uniref:hypothetical protein n=1 Tax=Microbacterium enclense TaxID=993073 RepID=UPI003F7D709A
MKRRRQRIRDEVEDAITELRAEGRKSRGSALWTAVAVAVITGVSTVGAAAVTNLAPQPTVSCLDAYQDAITMYEKDGVYFALPEDNAQEVECDVNGRIADLLKQPHDLTVYIPAGVDETSGGTSGRW